MKVLWFLALTAGLIAAATAAISFNDPQTKQPWAQAVTVRPYTSRRPYTYRPRTGLYEQPLKPLNSNNARTIAPPRATKRSHSWSYTTPRPQLTATRPGKMYPSQVKPLNSNNARTIAPPRAIKRSHSWSYTTRRPQLTATRPGKMHPSQVKPLNSKNARTIAPPYATQRPHSWSYTTRPQLI